MYRSHLFGFPAIISCSPASNKYVLQSPEDFGIGWPVPELVGKFTMSIREGKEHARLRGFLINAINQPEALKRIATTVQPRVLSAIRSWVEKGTIRAFDETNKVTFENILHMFVSMEPGPLPEALKTYFRGVVAGIRAQPLNIPGTAFHHALKCRRNLMEVFRTELEKRKQICNGTPENNDLMHGLMHIKDEEGNQLSDEEVVDNIVTTILGGYESTAYATAWALYYVSKSPDVLQKLREENTAISKGKKGDYISIEDISKLKYTAKVVEETIRIANIAPIIFRTASRDIDYRGYRIPKGWKVVIWLRNLHTDPKNFEDPLNFNPDRWNKPAKPGTYQAFGGGPRICPGNMLARLQVSIVLHHLAIGYKWELINPDAKMSYLPHPSPVDRGAMTFHAL